MITVVCGRPGAGKTILAKMFTGLLKPDKDHILFKNSGFLIAIPEQTYLHKNAATVMFFGNTAFFRICR